MKQNQEKRRLIALYIRVSTEAQAEEGYSIEAQEKILRAECTAKEYDESLIRTYIDAGASGSNIQRPALKNLIDDASAGLISTVIVYKLDRLSRSQKDTLYLIEDVFIPNRVDFVSVNERLDTGSPYGKAMIGILSAFAQLERENIFMRTRMGMKERVRSGLWPGGGRVPFGYDYDSGRGILVPNSDAQTVRRHYELYLEGHSLSYIAQILGLKYERLARQILLRKSNTGMIVYNGEEYPGLHEAIIDTETYDKAMREFQRRSQNTRRGGTHLLTGLLFCGYCGAKLRYQKWNKSGGCKLVCYSRDKSKPYLVKDENCPFEPLWADDLEEYVLRDVWSLPLKEEAQKDLQSPGPSILADLRKREERVTSKLKRLYSLYAESDDDVLLETIHETNQQLQQVRGLIRQEEENGALSGHREELKREISEVRDLWEFMTRNEQQIFLKKIINRITVRAGSVTIDYNL